MAVRPAAVAYEAKKGLATLFAGAGRNWYIWLILLTMGGGLIRGCASMLQPPHAPPIQQKAPPSED
ncbi:MAG: hypothetical protein ABUL49_00300 [bacterium]